MDDADLRRALELSLKDAAMPAHETPVDDAMDVTPASEREAAALKLALERSMATAQLQAPPS